jgi:hypothetical protein
MQLLRRRRRRRWSRPNLKVDLVYSKKGFEQKWFSDRTITDQRRADWFRRRGHLKPDLA